MICWLPKGAIVYLWGKVARLSNAKIKVMIKKTHPNNLFKVYKFTVENDTYTGKFKAASGFAISNSLKEARKEARSKVLEQLGSFCGCQVDGGTLIMKGQKVLYCSYDCSPESVIKATINIRKNTLKSIK